MADRQVLARVIPFAIYLVFLGVADLLRRSGLGESELRWLYPVKIFSVCLALAIFWRDYQELKVFKFQSATFFKVVVAGVLVMVLWVSLDASWMRLGANAGFNPRIDGEINWTLVALRIAGAALVVPVMEELFWRSFLTRWIDYPEFLGKAPNLISFKALVISSLIFGVEHSEWFAGVVAGLVYGWLYKRCDNLWWAILAHGVTNGLLGVWVVSTGQWTYW